MSKAPKKTTKFQPEIIEQLKGVLKDAPKIPPKTELTRADVIRGLREEIETLLSRNYSLSQIAKLLRENGFSISLSSLRSYLKARSDKPKATSPKTAKTEAGINTYDPNPQGMADIPE